jgi:hypothetical protein
MARKRNQVNACILEALKDQVKLRSNLECNSFADMQQLQQEIRKTMNEYLSLQTLNRLFGIIRNDFSPSLNTLNILAQYLQYNSFQEFVELNDKPGLLKRLASFESKFIFSVFSSVDPDKGDSQVLQTVIRNILNITNEDPQIASGLYPAMASIPFGRRYFLERYVNMDSLAKHYGDGLSYYLLYAKSREEQFFAYNLHCLRYFLTADHELFVRYFAHINSFPKDEISTYKPDHIGHYLASLILNQSVTGKQTDQLFATTLSDNIDIRLSGNKPSAYQAWYRVTEALVLTGEFEKAWEKLNDQLLSAPGDNCIDTDFQTQVNLLHLVSGFYSGNIPLIKARQIFSELNAKPLHTTVQDYCTILLLLLKKSLFPKAVGHKETDAKIDRLIMKTGFVYFHIYEKILKEILENELMDINGKKRY